ncbi:MAG: redox-sensing transcriptional repressor Rex [Lachnospiraceae bacterium]|nr:redox-sensing transcriptional repressor Rex [Lachnospiraceae bacterium]
MEHKNISQAVIKRLPRYYRYLGDLLENGVDRISSSKLSELMSITASQIRQDLNNFGGFGQQGYGYNVSYLHEEIGNILELHNERNMIVIGAGNVGRAISNHTDFYKIGIKVTAIFDNNLDAIGTKINEIEVFAVDKLVEYIENNKVDIVAITVPKDSAVRVAAAVVEVGVKAIWNFAPVDLNVPQGITVENVHLTDSLMTLSYNMNNECKIK